ncbi:hypothetical protein NST63_17890 [Heyndrickxia sp. FSL W8-0496]|uniref:hypothetical protein n=1 Tax=Heyndrickxia sp. FSL W8-0496 TaxID=2954702 RepID=UPI0030F7EBC5
MIWIIGGLIFMIFGLYIIPLKEVEYKSNDYIIPKWFYILTYTWVLATMAYIPSIIFIFLDGLEYGGYISSTADYVDSYPVWILTVAIYILIYKIYTSRIKKFSS